MRLRLLELLKLQYSVAAIKLQGHDLLATILNGVVEKQRVGRLECLYT